MKLKIIGFATVVLALAGCASTNRVAAIDHCAYVNNKLDGTYTFTESGITVSECVSGEFWQYYRQCANLSYSNGQNWYSAMKYAQDHQQHRHDKRVWRMPTKEDVAVIGNCIKGRKEFWVAASSENKQNAIAFENGRYVEKSRALNDESIRGVIISGDNGAAQQAYQHVFDESVKPYWLAQNAAWEKRKSAEKAELALDTKRRDAVERQQTIAIASSPKGSLLNCNTGVVPVNMSLNVVNFTCPTLGKVTLETLLKNRWKMTSNERIKASSSNYREGAFGMDDWNGQGVIISIMVEKQ